MFHLVVPELMIRSVDRSGQGVAAASRRDKGEAILVKTSKKV